MPIRSKFCLTEIHNYAHGGAKFIFEPRYDESIPEDQRFHKATPSGRIEMHINNPVAIEQFKVGGYYYFDAIPVV